MTKKVVKSKNNIKREKTVTSKNEVKREKSVGKKSGLNALKKLKDQIDKYKNTIEIQENDLEILNEDHNNELRKMNDQISKLISEKELVIKESNSYINLIRLGIVGLESINKINLKDDELETNDVSSLQKELEKCINQYPNLSTGKVF